MKERFASILVDIDFQHDFSATNGALYVPGAQEILPHIRRLFGAAVERGVPVVSTADTHTVDDPEFRTYGFPSHCVVGTWGQQRHPAALLADRVVIDPEEVVSDVAGLLRRHAQVIFQKRTLDVWTSAAARRLLETVEAEAWHVFGLATDYCVKSAALGLAKAGQRTYVVTDAVAAITPEGEKAAIEEMRAAGVGFVTTDEVLDALRRAQEPARQ